VVPPLPGGIGTVSGSMVGGLVMGVLNLGLANLTVDSNFIQIIKGMALLLAVAFDVRSKQQGRPSFIAMIMSGMNRTSSPPPAQGFTTACAGPSCRPGGVCGTKTPRQGRGWFTLTVAAKEDADDAVATLPLTGSGHSHEGRNRPWLRRRSDRGGVG